MSYFSSTTTGNCMKNSCSADSATSNHRDSVEEGTSRAALARPACAACKHQRRKCAANCLLAPYFPAHLQRQFLNAHHLYGVKSITRIVRGLDPVRRDNAMYSIIYESNARARDRVGGCLRVIRELERQLRRESTELALVFQQLAICRAQATEATALQASSTGVIPNIGADCNLVVYMNSAIDNGDENATHTALHGQQTMQRQYCYGYAYDGGADDQYSMYNVACNENTNSNSNTSTNNCNANTSERDRVVLKMQVQVALPTLNAQAQQDQEDELEPGDLAHDVFDVTRQQPLHQEGDSSDNVDAESFPCRLGLGFA